MAKSNSDIRVYKKINKEKKSSKVTDSSNNKIKIYINNKILYTSPEIGRAHV